MKIGPRIVSLLAESESARYWLHFCRSSDDDECMMNDYGFMATNVIVKAQFDKIIFSSFVTFLPSAFF